MDQHRVQLVGDRKHDRSVHHYHQRSPVRQSAGGRNKIRFRATNNNNVTSPYWVYTVRGLDQAYATLGASIVSDGIYHPGGDGDTTPATIGGRECRRLTRQVTPTSTSR